MTRRPIVLIAPRFEAETVRDSERISSQESIAACFVDAIIAAGGLPLQMSLTTDEAVIDEYLELADGIAIPGGPDVNPARWGSEEPYDSALLCEARDAFEFPLVRRAVAADVPLLTTCRGTQLLNVALGGDLCMDVSSLGAREGMVQWRHTGILNTVSHPVEVEAGSMLSRALGGVTLIQTNSAHHCCVQRLGEGVRLVARATDGVPEGIEVAGRRFCIGVQWHPEYTWHTLSTDFTLWRSFVEACRERSASRSAQVVEGDARRAVGDVDRPAPHEARALEGALHRDVVGVGVGPDVVMGGAEKREQR